ncbi:helix-turn-helix domain-containing protein [Streptomyces halobius]|uniref:Helix-turn-helix domain-containing protein n=1 Tax=Streptomyces halobius TaxID=2879846 RepID=A0ABY4M9Z2_9ACTN|nr:helix-turn-helix transcriptional regulator [Streptomyces halobius]UQA94508.1 helix-turn-helix domain-containing protein [Streptomyces halobius]
MPVRKPPTERQRRLGAELRKMRERAGLTINAAAAMHHTDRTTVTNTEVGRIGVSADRVRIWAANYCCPERDYADALVAMARERRIAEPGWWDEYRGMVVARLLDLAEMEHHAVALRTVQIVYMPGLLQCEDYARAVIEEAMPPPTPEALERMLSFRMRRSDVLDGPRPPKGTFIVHEAALRMRFGTREVSKAQLAHLLKQSERENVMIRVVPFAAGGFPQAGSSTLYAHGPVPQLDTVQIETAMGAEFLDAENHLANYRAVLDRTEQRALSPARSQDFIREVARQL